jgi:hypothetical protein
VVTLLFPGPIAPGSKAIAELTLVDAVVRATTMGTTGAAAIGGALAVSIGTATLALAGTTAVAASHKNKVILPIYDQL